MKMALICKLYWQYKKCEHNICYNYLHIVVVYLYLMLSNATAEFTELMWFHIPKYIQFPQPITWICQQLWQLLTSLLQKAHSPILYQAVQTRIISANCSFPQMFQTETIHFVHMSQSFTVRVCWMNRSNVYRTYKTVADYWKIARASVYEHACVCNEYNGTLARGARNLYLFK